MSPDPYEKKKQNMSKIANVKHFDFHKCIILTTSQVVSWLKNIKEIAAIHCT